MKCVTCGTKMRVQERAHAVKVGGTQIKGALPAYVCARCGASRIAVEALARFELQAAAALAERGVCTGESFRFMRKALAMRATDVATTLGTTAETVSRWENGQRDVDRHVFALLAELVIAAAEGRPSPAARFRMLASRATKQPAAIRIGSKARAA